MTFLLIYLFRRLPKDIYGDVKFGKKFAIDF